MSRHDKKNNVMNRSKKLRDKQQSLKSGEALMVPHWILLLVALVSTSPALLILVKWWWVKIIGLLYVFVVAYGFVWIQAKKLEVQANFYNTGYSQGPEVWDAKKEANRGR